MTESPRVLSRPPLIVTNFISFLCAAGLSQNEDTTGHSLVRNMDIEVIPRSYKLEYLCERLMDMVSLADSKFLSGLYVSIIAIVLLKCCVMEPFTG